MNSSDKPKAYQKLTRTTYGMVSSKIINKEYRWVVEKDGVCGIDEDLNMAYIKYEHNLRNKKARVRILSSNVHYQYNKKQIRKKVILKCLKYLFSVSIICFIGILILLAHG